jgi:hypothetical protein
MDKKEIGIIAGGIAISIFLGGAFWKYYKSPSENPKNSVLEYVQNARRVALMPDPEAGRNMRNEYDSENTNGGKSRKIRKHKSKTRRLK